MPAAHAPWRVLSRSTACAPAQPGQRPAFSKLRHGAQYSCCIRSDPRLPPSSAVELPAACRKARSPTRAAAGLCAPADDRRDPAPVSVSPTGATETGYARRPGSHAPRGFRAVPQRVKTRETTPLTVSEDSEAGAARAPVEPDQHRRGHKASDPLDKRHEGTALTKCPSPPACPELIRRIKTHQLAWSRGYVSSSEGAGALRRPRGLVRLDRAAGCVAPAMHKHLDAGACACLEVHQ